MGNLSKRLLSIIAVTTVITGMGLPTIAKAETVNQGGTSTLTAGTLSILPSVPDAVEKTSASDYGLTQKTKDGVILHAFCWSFNTIKDNMADIAAAGYSTVQTSPANECLAGEGGGMDLMGNGKWYYHYQPTDWKIGNYQLGSRDDFKAMCAEGDKFGVKIIVDVLPNHTTPTLTAVAGSLKEAAGGQDNLYHANGFKGITQWQNRFECTTGMMGGLPDVNTENKGFQKYYMDYVNDVIACGGDGFRYDTAKHIGVPSDPKDAKSQENDFWPVVSGKKEVNGTKLADNGNLFIYGEVLQDQGVPYEEYGQYMNLTASGYGGKIRGAIRGKNFEVGNISDWCHPTPNKIVTWVESHDTYFNEGESRWMSDWDIRMCWALITARDKGTPLFFSRPDGSSSGNYLGKNKIGAKGNDQFKDPEVVAVNKFHNAMVGQAEKLSNIDGGQCLVVERGNKGITIINLGGEKQISTSTGLADGTYKDQVSGTSFTVSGGKLSGKVAGGKIAVIYNAGDTTTTKPDTTKPDTTKPDTTKPDTTKPSTDVAIDVPAGKNIAILKLPSGWAGASIYVYDEATKGVQNAKWPGVAMTKVSEGLYSYEIPSDYKKPLVIFTDGTESGSKYPTGAQTPGLAIEGAMIYDGSTFSKYVPPTKVDTTKPDTTKPDTTKPDTTKPDTTKPDTTKPDTTKPDTTKPATSTPIKEDVKVSLNFDVKLQQVVGTKINLKAKASKVNSKYEYRFKASNGTSTKVIKDYSSESSVIWEPTSEGDYSVFVEVRDADKKVITSEKTTFSITASKNTQSPTENVLPEIPQIPGSTSQTTNTETNNKPNSNSASAGTADSNTVLPIIGMMAIAAGSLLKVSKKQRNI